MAKTMGSLQQLLHIWWNIGTKQLPTHANQDQDRSIQSINYPKLVLVRDNYPYNIFNLNTGRGMAKAMGSLQQLLHI
jgi:hypothetical protein